MHSQLPASRFEDIDVVVHSGDASNVRNPRQNAIEMLSFLEWYMHVPVKHKIYVAGNHDTSVEKNIVNGGEFAAAGVIYLENSSTTIDGVKFWGSPITPTFGDWAFMKARQKLHEVWQKVPVDTDVLITHGPPKGVRDLSFDRTGKLEMCGDLSLVKRCWELRDTLKLHCFGHIHNMKDINTNQGVSHYSKTKTVFSNAACVVDGRFDYGLSTHGNIITI